MFSAGIAYWSWFSNFRGPEIAVLGALAFATALLIAICVRSIFQNRTIPEQAPRTFGFVQGAKPTAQGDAIVKSSFIADGILHDRPLANHQELQSSHIRGKTLFIHDIPRDKHQMCLIRGRVFEDCTIFGPAVVRFHPVNVSMTDTTFDNEGDNDKILWPIKKIGGVIGMFTVDTCEFNRCLFKGVGLAGTREQLRDIKQIWQKKAMRA